MRLRPRVDRQGMALLTVLLLVAVMASVAVAILDDVRFSVRRTMNAETGSQAQWYADGAETLARRRLGRLAEGEADGPRPPIVGADVTFSLPIEGGSLTALIEDGQTCFNLNSIVEWTGDRLEARPAAAADLAILGRSLGLEARRMDIVVDSLIDWIDTDTTPRPQGAEDAAYAGLAEPYRTGGVPLAEVSELRTVRGVSQEIYDRLRPHLCALPTDRTTININALGARDAPLLVMLAKGRLDLATARTVIASRPASGWTDVDAFWSSPGLQGLGIAPVVRDQTTIRSDYFRVRIDVELGSQHSVRTALIEARPGMEARTVIRRWTAEE